MKRSKTADGGEGECMQSADKQKIDATHTDIHTVTEVAAPQENGDAPLTATVDAPAAEQKMPEAEIKVSVIVPIFNAEEFLRPAMDSILDQTLREIEVICVDDGSTDGSLKIVKEYQARDSRVRIATQNNAGPGMARNNGLRRARGEYVSFLDADDFFAPDFLLRMYETAKADDLDIVVGDYDLYQNKNAKFRKNVISEEQNLLTPGKVTSKNDFPDQIFQLTDGYVWSKLFRRAFIVEKKLLFPEELRMFEDVYFIVTSLSLAERIGKCEGIFIHHRVYNEQARGKLFRKYYAQAPKMYADIKAFLMQHGMYLPLSVSFVNLTASRCFKIYNLLWADAKEEFYTMLHEEFAERMGWSEIAAEDYTDPAVCRFAATVQMYTYDQSRRREARGRGPSLAFLKQWMARKRKNRRKEPGRIAKLFSRIFGKLGFKKKNKKS